MGKWIYLDTEDGRIADAVMTTMGNLGYRPEQRKAEPNSPVKADVAIFANHVADNRRLSMGGVTLDLDSVSAELADGTSIHFTPIEFSMLSYLLKNKQRAVSKDELLPAVWGFSNDTGTRVADDTVKRLRRKLLPTSLHIETVWGYGFKLSVA